MIEATELSSYLDQLLGCANFDDYAPNGLQIEGIRDIRLICTAVTASLEAIDEAVALGANALLVHHGYFWRGEPAVLTGMKRQRIARLIQHNLNLYAYHLPLDCHPELGNNACIAHILGIKQPKMHTVGRIPNLFWTGSFHKEKSPDVFFSELSQHFGREPIYVAGNNRPIQHLAWCSGGAQDYIEQAHALGADAYISGEISERTYYQAKELGIHYFACGHHATERYGIQALGSHLASKYELEHHFIDSPNPV